MTPQIVAAAAALALAASPAAGEPRRVEGTLAGHALLPALTLTEPPPDAPRAFYLSGRFAAGAGERVLDPWSVPRRGGLALPFIGQPVQGLSGVVHAGDGVYWTLSDNGFGSRANSADAMLMAHVMVPDWETGGVARARTVFLSDPDRRVPFRIVNEFTERRYLTGADLDLEAIQPTGERLWFGDEFGPYLLATDLDGRVVFFAETMLGDRPLRSPDHHGVGLPDLPGPVAFDIRRSRGFEGMALSPDGATLYPLLEGPVLDADGAAETGETGRALLRLLEFSVPDEAWTGRSWLYPLDDPDHAIGDFNMISATRGLVVERDWNQGDPALACAEGEMPPGCFDRPAAFKRVYVIDLEGVEPGGTVRKVSYVDLLDIADPEGRAKVGGRDGRLAFPFVTVEGVDAVDGSHIVVTNDNNLPFSSGRTPGEADANEWVLIEVGDMLR